MNNNFLDELVDKAHGKTIVIKDDISLTCYNTIRNKDIEQIVKDTARAVCDEILKLKAHDRSISASVLLEIGKIANQCDNINVTKN